MSFVNIDHVPYGIPKKRVRPLSWNGSASILPQSPTAIHFTTEDEINNQLSKENKDSSYAVFALNIPQSESSIPDHKSKNQPCSSYIFVHFQFGQQLHPISQRTNILIKYPGIPKNINNGASEEISSPKQEDISCTVSPSALKKFEELVYDIIPGIAKVIAIVYKDPNQLQSSPNIIASSKDETGYTITSLISALQDKPYLVTVLMDGILFFVREETTVQICVLMVDLDCSLNCWVSSTQIMSSNKVNVNTSAAMFIQQSRVSPISTKLRFSSDYDSLVEWAISACNHQDEHSHSTRAVSKSSRRYWPFKRSASSLYPEEGVNAPTSPNTPTITEGKSVALEPYETINNESFLMSKSAPFEQTSQHQQASEQGMSDITTHASTTKNSNMNSSNNLGGGGGDEPTSRSNETTRSSSSTAIVASDRTPQLDLSKVIQNGLLNIEKLNSFLESMIGQKSEVDEPSQKRFTLQFWSAVYGLANSGHGTLEKTLAVLEGVVASLKWPSLFRSFIVSGGPFWLSWLHMALPGCPRPGGLPEEALLDAQLQQIQDPLSSSRTSSTYHSNATSSSNDATSPIGRHSSTNTLSNSFLKEGQQEDHELMVVENEELTMIGSWALLECEEDENRTWRLDAVEEMPSQMECTSPQPPALWSSRQDAPQPIPFSTLDSVFTSMTAVTERRLRPMRLDNGSTIAEVIPNGDDSQRSTVRDYTDNFDYNGYEQDQLMAVLCGTSDVDHSNSNTPSIPKLPLGALPSNKSNLLAANSSLNLSQRQSSNRHTSILVGSLMRGGIGAQGRRNSGGGHHPMDEWIASGGGIDLSVALKYKDGKMGSIEVEAVTTIENLTCDIFYQILSRDEQGYETASVEAASVFLCTMKGRAYRTNASLSANIIALSDLVSDMLDRAPPSVVPLNKYQSLGKNSSSGMNGSEWGNSNAGGGGGDGGVDSFLTKRDGPELRSGKQLANRCEAIVSVERKVNTLQRHRYALWVTASERKWWVQQMCACSAERALYTLLIKDAVNTTLSENNSKIGVGIQLNPIQPATTTTIKTEACDVSFKQEFDHMNNKNLESWVKVCCDVLSPLNETRSRSNFAVSHLQGSSVHILIGVLDSLFEASKGNVTELLREMSQAEPAIAVIVSHLEWLFSSFGDLQTNMVSPTSKASKLNDVTGPLRPFSMETLDEFRKTSLQFIRRLSECCACACACAPSSCSATYGRLVLRHLEVEGMDEILFRTLDAFKIIQISKQTPTLLMQSSTSSPSSVSSSSSPSTVSSPLTSSSKEWRFEEVALIQDVLSCLTAAHSDRLRLTRSGVRLLEPTLAILKGIVAQTIDDNKQVVDDDEKQIQSSSMLVLCHRCLQLLVVVARARGVGEADHFHSTKVVSFLLDMTSAVQFLPPHSSSSSKLASSPSNTREVDEPLIKHKVDEDVLPVIKVTDTFEIGQRVRGRWLIDDKERWFPGNIIGINESLNTYSVKYDDGDEEVEKLSTDIKLLSMKPRLHPPTKLVEEPKIIRNTPSPSLINTTRSSGSGSGVRTVSSPVGKIPEDTVIRSSSDNSPTIRSGSTPFRRSSTTSFDGSVGIFSDGDDDMFVSIPSSLPNRKEKERNQSLGLNFTALQESMGFGGSAHLDQSAGFSSLTGFGMSSQLDQTNHPGGSSISNHNSPSINPILFKLSNDIKSHELALTTLLLLTLAPDGRRLERSATDVLLGNGRNYDLISFLHRHLSSQKAVRVVPLLHIRCQKPTSLGLLLRLLSTQLLDTDSYQASTPISPKKTIYSKDVGENQSKTEKEEEEEEGDGPRNLGQGSFGRVVSVPCPGACFGGPKRVAIKMTRSGARSVFEEVVALRLCGGINAPRLIDLGFCDKTEEFWLVMEQCTGSLKQWRLERDLIPSAQDVMTYLKVFRGVAVSVCGLAESAIVHFDLKCDNILIREDPSRCDDSTSPSKGKSSLSIPSVCIGDFGEACVIEASNAASGIRLQRARGTECVQSPEMLLVKSFGDNDATAPTLLPGIILSPTKALTSSTTCSVIDSTNSTSRITTVRSADSVEKTSSQNSSRGGDTSTTNAVIRSPLGYRREYVSCASDVWSLGCLLFELICGDFLYNVTANEGGWSHLFVLLTRPDGPLFLERKLNQMKALPFSSIIEKLLRDLLIRNPDHRPSAVQALKLIDLAISEMSKQQTEGSINNNINAVTVETVVEDQESNHDIKAIIRSTSQNDQIVKKPPSSIQTNISCSNILSSLNRGNVVWQATPSLLIAHASSPSPSVSEPNALTEQSMNIALPTSWMDDTVLFDSNHKQKNLKLNSEHMKALGVSHVIEVINDLNATTTTTSSSSGSNVVTPVSDNRPSSGSKYPSMRNCEFCHSPCDHFGRLAFFHLFLPQVISPHENQPNTLSNDRVKRVDLKSLSKLIVAICDIIKEGGHILLTSKTMNTATSPSSSSVDSSSETINAEMECVGTWLICVALVMHQRKCSLFDALVKIRCSNAAFSLPVGYAEQLIAWKVSEY